MPIVDIEIHQPAPEIFFFPRYYGLPNIRPSPTPPEAHVEIRSLNVPEYSHYLNEFGGTITIAFHDMILTGELIEYRLKKEADGSYHEDLFLRLGEYSQKIEQDELDQEFPHQCYRCQKDLYFQELLAANLKYPKEYLEQLWKLECVEFYCCSCYKIKAEEKNNGQNTEIID